MDSYYLFGFVGILRESIKLISKNGKPMAFIATLFLSFSSLFFLLNHFSLKPLIYDLILKEILLPTAISNTTDFANLLAGIKKDFRILIGVESVFIFAFFIVSLFSTIATVFVSAKSYCGRNVSVRDLLSSVSGSWTRPFVTRFHTTLLSTGYFVFFIGMLIPVLMISDRPVISKAIIIVLVILASIFNIYLSVVWVLAFVISVIDESCYGIEALGKAARLVKGNRLHGFMLNFLLNVVCLILFQGYIRIIKVQPSLATLTIAGLLLINSICLAMMFLFVAYTVLYFQCKKNHGEEIELQGSVEYSKIPNAPLGHKDIP